MKTATEIENWIRTYLVEAHQVPAAELSATATFDRLGLDSASAVALITDLEDWLGVEMDPALPYDFPTLGELSQEVARLSEPQPA